MFQNRLVGKASKTFSFQHVRLMEPNIPAMLERDAAQGYLRVFCFRNILVAKASKTFFLSLVQLIQPKIPAILERDQAESGPSPIIRLRSAGAPQLGSPIYTGRFLSAPESSRVTSSIG